MTITTPPINELQDRIAAMESRLQSLYTALVQKGIIEVASPQRPPVSRAALRAELLARGVTRLPSPEELAVAARWRSRPSEERVRLVAKLENLWLDPPLSEIIHEMRSR